MLGAIITVVTGSDPGAVLGDLIVLGAVIAALGVHRSRVHRLFPLPALTYLLLAVITGFIHDSSAATSTTQLGVYFLQWIGSGFFAMFAATLLVGLILGARMLAARQLVSGSFTMSQPRPAASRGDGSVLAPGGRPGSGRDSRDDRRAPKDDADAWYEEPRADTRRPGRDRGRREVGDQRSSGRSRSAWTEGWSIGDPLPKKKPAPADRDGESKTRVMPPERKAPAPKPASQPGFSPRGGRVSRDGGPSRDDRRPGYSPRPGFSPRDSGDGYSPRER